MFITFGGLGAHCTFGNFVSFILCRPTVYDKMERQNYLTSCRRKKRMSNHLSLMRRSDIIFLPQQFCCIFFNSNFYRSEKLIGIIFLKPHLPAATFFWCYLRGRGSLLLECLLRHLGFHRYLEVKSFPLKCTFSVIYSVGFCRGSRVRCRGSRVEGRGSRVEAVKQFKKLISHLKL